MAAPGAKGCLSARAGPWGARACVGAEGGGHLLGRGGAAVGGGGAQGVIMSAMRRGSAGLIERGEGRGVSRAATAVDAGRPAREQVHGFVSLAAGVRRGRRSTAGPALG
jgi:hypothetical protein